MTCALQWLAYPRSTAQRDAWRSAPRSSRMCPVIRALHWASCTDKERPQAVEGWDAGALERSADALEVAARAAAGDAVAEARPAQLAQWALCCLPRTCSPEVPPLPAGRRGRAAVAEQPTRGLRRARCAGSRARARAVRRAGRAVARARCRVAGARGRRARAAAAGGAGGVRARCPPAQGTASGRRACSESVRGTPRCHGGRGSLWIALCPKYQSTCSHQHRGLCNVYRKPGV